MSESEAEMMTRVELMSGNDTTWDLSPKDRRALKRVVERVAAAEARAVAAEAREAKLREALTNARRALYDASLSLAPHSTDDRYAADALKDIDAALATTPPLPPREWALPEWWEWRSGDYGWVAQSRNDVGVWVGPSDKGARVYCSMREAPIAVVLAVIARNGGTP